MCGRLVFRIEGLRHQLFQDCVPWTLSNDLAGLHDADVMHLRKYLRSMGRDDAGALARPLSQPDNQLAFQFLIQGPCWLVMMNG